MVWNVLVLSWRRDIDGSVDLVEEVVCIIGIDNILLILLSCGEGVVCFTVI